jgi:hypothetical protein
LNAAAKEPSDDSIIVEGQDSRGCNILWAIAETEIPHTWPKKPELSLLQQNRASRIQNLFKDNFHFNRFPSITDLIS